VKTGISSRLLKPTLGYLDPEHTRTLPPAVTAKSEPGEFSGRRAGGLDRELDHPGDERVRHR